MKNGISQGVLKQMAFALAAGLLAVGGVSRRIVAAAPDDTEPPPAAVAVEERMVVAEANFDQWVFQSSGSTAEARRQIESQLMLQLNDADRVCRLTKGQKQKLMLAAEGDIKQFFEDVEQARAKFRAVQNDPQAFDGVWEFIQPLQQKLARGLFGETSFFAKTLRKTLTTDQAENYRANLAERRKYRHRATIEAGLVTLENSVPLDERQHETLLGLLLQRTRPPATFGKYDYYLVMHELSKLPKDDLRAVFDDRQWQLLTKQFARVAGMAPMLAQIGIVVEEESDAEPGNRDADNEKANQ